MVLFDNTYSLLLYTHMSCKDAIPFPGRLLPVKLNISWNFERKVEEMNTPTHIHTYLQYLTKKSPHKRFDL